MLPRCVALILVIPITACESARSILPSTARTISLSEFAEASPTESATGAEPDPAVGAASAASTTDPTVDAPLAPTLGDATETPPGPGTAPLTRPISPGQSVHVDSLVGQVNGRPLFADDFFQPIADQLAAKARSGTPREFVIEADRIISRHLREVVLNELFLAEAESGLSEEQQAGLLYWLRETQRETVRMFGPTRSTAEQRLFEEEGITLEEFMQRRRDTALIQDLVAKRIRSRVVVSWRDIEREYERNRERYQPPARVSLSRIRLFTTTDADAIEDVQRRLTAGEPFASIVESIGLPKAGPYDVFVMGPGGVSDIQVSEPIRQQIEGLDVGGTTDAFVVGSTTWWLHVDSIEQPPGRSLFDPEVQAELTESIFNQRFKEEDQRYVQSLLEKGIVDDLDAMKFRLLQLAVVRYGPRT